MPLVASSVPKPASEREHQLDHFFISGDWSLRVHSYDIVDNDEVRHLR
jgi:hypothetical protein